MTAEPHDPAATTIRELLDHVKLHLTPEAHLDDISDYAVEAIAGLTIHALMHFGLKVVPASSGDSLPPPTPLEVGRIEPDVPTALELLGGALARWARLRVGRVFVWLDARLESPS